MKVEAEQQLNELVEYISTSVKTAGDFVMEQRPLLVQEILTYNGIVSGGLSLLGSILFIIAIIGLLKINWERIKEVDGAVLVQFSLSMLSILISPFVFWYNIFTFLKITFAPRLYLLEYVKDLM